MSALTIAHREARTLAASRDGLTVEALAVRDRIRAGEYQPDDAEAMARLTAALACLPDPVAYRLVADLEDCWGLA